MMRLSKYNSIGMMLLGIFLASSCGVLNPRSESSSKSVSVRQDIVKIPVSLEPLKDGLNLSASSFEIVISDCLSGANPVGSISESDSNIPLVIGDRDCLAKLNRFTINNTIYTPTSGDPFTTWQVGDTALFEDSTQTSMIAVEVLSTLSSPIDQSDTISYGFADAIAVDTNSTDNLLESYIQSLSGEVVSSVSTVADWGDYDLRAIELDSIDSSFNASLTVKLECQSTVAGGECDDVPLPAGGGSGDDTYNVTYGYKTASSFTQTWTYANIESSSTTVTGTLLTAGSGGLTNGGVEVDNVILPIGSYITFWMKINKPSGDGAGTSFIYWNIYVNPSSDAFEVSACGGTFAYGAGTVGDPYLIFTRTHLESVGLCTSSSDYFKLINNIDLGGSGSPWTPITLSGQFDGNDYTISNLYISSSDPRGLFTTIEAGASASNIILQSASVIVLPGGTGDNGVLSGNNDGTVTNCSTSGTIVVNADTQARSGSIGGLIGGSHSSGTIIDSSSSVTLTVDTPSRSYFGGLVGFIGGASISGSSATGDITANASATSIFLSIGGLVGWTNSGTVSNSYSTGSLSSASTGTVRMGMIALRSSSTLSRLFSTGTYSITGSAVSSANIGGLIGYDSCASCTTTDSYSMVTISVAPGLPTSSGKIGGFVGNKSTSTITNSYSASPSMPLSINAGTVFGFVGQQPATGITNSYLHANGSVPADSTSGVTSYTTTTQMETQGNFNFDFTTPLWYIPVVNPLSPSSLLSPVLSWQCGNNGVVCFATCSATDFGGGSGTSGDPWQIATRAHLQHTESCTSSSDYFIQTTNIDLGGSGNPWVPIDLYGQYDGGSYTINNLYINDTNGVRHGLFQTIESQASVSNLNLDVDITSDSRHVGALAGYANTGSTITNVHTSGTINHTFTRNSSHVSGLVGIVSCTNIATTISNASSSVDLTITPSGANAFVSGGLIGRALGPSTVTCNISDSFATGDITFNSGSFATSNSVSAGGFIGYLGDGDFNITRSYTSGVNITTASTVSGGSSMHVGGFFGTTQVTTSVVSESFAESTISVNNTSSTLYAGGFVGANIDNVTFEDSYSMGSIFADGSGGASGGFVGRAAGTASTYTRCYSALSSMTAVGVTSTGFLALNQNSSTITDSYLYDNASVPSDSATGLTSYTTSTQMETQGNFNFDFTTPIWQMAASNPLSPSGLLSPVPNWICGTNGISCFSQVPGCGVTFGGGSGTVGDPWLIATRTHLENTESCNTSSHYFLQIADIDLGGSGTPWPPIDLYGQYDGGDKTISNMYYDNTSVSRVGLFGNMLSGSSLSNLSVTDFYLRGAKVLGGAVADVTESNTTVTNVHTTGDIVAQMVSTGDNDMGGVIGFLGVFSSTGGSVASNLTSDVDFTINAVNTGQGYWMKYGGIVGHLRANATLSGCRSMGNFVTNSSTSSADIIGIGGVVGMMERDDYTQVIEDCEYHGNITASIAGAGSLDDFYVGGITGVGKDTDSGNQIRRTYSTGTYTISNSSGTDWSVGGIFGGQEPNSGTRIDDSYTTATIVSQGSGGDGYAAGFVGRRVSSNQIRTSYSASPSVSGSGATIRGFSGTTANPNIATTYMYDNAGVPSQSLSGLTSYTTQTQMETQSNFTGFDFTTPIWVMPTANPLSPGGVLSPVLEWQCGQDGITCP